MPHRLLTLSSAVGLTVAGTIGAVAGPATAAPAQGPVTSTVAVPVTCVFTPTSQFSPAFDATVKLTAPATVKAGATYKITVQVSTPIGNSVPIALNGLGFTSTLTATGARPAKPIVLTQAPVDLNQGANAPAQTFKRRLRAGAAGSTITYALTQHSYTFKIVGGIPDQIVANCTPNAGGPVTIATTNVVGRR